MFGGRGNMFALTAHQDYKYFSTGIFYKKIFKERLDNYFCANNDKFGVNFHFSNSKFYDSLLFTISKVSRQNYVNFLSENDKKTLNFLT
jgi:hypothetical protein